MREAKIKAFTLVEILIVVMLLGLIAAIVIPKFSQASQTARASMLAENLRIMRTQIAVFAAEHDDVPPGYPGMDNTASPTQGAFADDMTMATTSKGDVAVPGTEGYPYGPYLRSMMPNPLNAKITIQFIDVGGDFPTEGDNSDGWIYKPDELLFKADSPDTDPNGKAFFDY